MTITDIAEPTRDVELGTQVDEQRIQQLPNSIVELPVTQKRQCNHL